MDNNPIISVIVPVYNVENYLDRCVQSILNQTYSELEIILVDDGSTDRCPEMCDTWAERDTRIRVIHKQNGGLSDARNVGLKAATGGYCAFVDSDDYIAPELFFRLKAAMEKDGSNIAACSVEMVDESGKTLGMLTVQTNCVMDSREAQAALLSETRLKQPVWYKLYERASIYEIFFPVGKYHEDVFWSYRAIGNAQRVSIIDYIGYYYVQRTGSIMGAGYSIKRLDAIEAKVERQTYLDQNYPELTIMGRVNLLFSSLYHGQMALMHLTGEEREYAMLMLKDIVGRYRLTWSERKGMKLPHRFWAEAARISFAGTCRLRNWAKIGN